MADRSRRTLAKGEDCFGPDLIYLPELPFDIEAFSEKVKDLLAKKPSVVVAVSEGNPSRRRKICMRTRTKR